jgi:hypothetical protein
MSKTAAKSERATEVRAVLPLPDRQAARLIAWPFEYCLRLQADALCAVGVSIIDWLRRRREGTDAAYETFERLAACRDFAEAATIQQEWFGGALRRLGSDIEALTDQLLVMSREAASLAQSAPQATAAAPTTPAWEVRKSQETGPATPARVQAAKAAESLAERA